MWKLLLCVCLVYYISESGAATTSLNGPVAVPPTKAEKKVVCYYTNWSWYRQGEGKYTPDNIDASLCTHIAYGFATLDPNTLTMKPYDTWIDIDNQLYAKVIALQAKGVKVVIALGGWNDSLGDKYSRMVNDPAARANFIAEAVKFIELYGFDGLDLDWEYPKCWQTECDKGPESDKPAFATLVREMKAAFAPRGLLLSSAVTPNKMIIDAGYDVKSVTQDFDWISVMTYDYHGQWDKQTGHVAPIYYYPGDIFDYFNIEYSINYWLEAGADPEKLILGIPIHGQTFTLANNNEHGLNALAYGPGLQGQFTGQAGFLAFYEICMKVKNEHWSVVRDPEARMGPYAYSGNQWVSYDDIDTVKQKSDLVKKWGLGGGMIWALDLDDFHNLCGCGTYPILRRLNHELRGTPLESNVEKCTQ